MASILGGRSFRALATRALVRRLGGRLTEPAAGLVLGHNWSAGDWVFGMELGVRTDLRESDVRTTEEYLDTTLTDGDVSSPYLFSHYEVLPDRAAKTRYDIEDIR